MSSLALDLRYAVRVLVKTPLITGAALLCLALGIGANTAVFSVTYAVLLRSLPFSQAEQLVVLGDRTAEEASTLFSPADYLDIRAQSRSLADVVALRSFSATLSSSGTPERIQAQSVAPGFFRLFRVEPRLGRFFGAGSSAAAGGTDLPDGTAEGRSVVLSHGSWQSRFGGDPDVIGRALSLNDEPHVIAGVAPEGFRFPVDAEIWVRAYRQDIPEPPINLGDDLAAVRDLGYLMVLGRLADGVTLTEAEAEMELLSARLMEAQEPGAERSELTIAILQDHLVGDTRAALAMLLGATVFLLLIACANVANLLLARSTAREQEVAVRTALGASRFRLVRQLLTENLLLGLVGGGLGLFLAYWGVDLLVLLAPEELPRAGEIGVDGWVLVFTLGLSVLTGLVFGVLPAVWTARPDLHAALKDGGRASTEGTRRRRARGLLVVAEVAVSLVLLAGTGLFMKSLLQLQSVDPGFRPEQTLAMRMELPRTRYAGPEPRVRFVNTVLERIDALPGVTSSGTCLALPFSGSAATFTVHPEGRPEPEEGGWRAEYQPVTPDYFRTMGIPLLRGRAFTAHDHAEAPPVVIVNRKLAQQHWPEEDPVGKRLGVGDPGALMEVVGVVGDVRHFGYDLPPRPEAYAPHAQDPWPFLSLVIRADAGHATLVDAVRAEILAVDPDQPVYGITTMEQLLGESLQQRRFTVRLLGLFAGLGIVLSLLGIYGVMSYAVSQRVHEFGIRAALGARRLDLLRLALRSGLALVLAGTALGLAVSLAFARFLSGLLYEVTSTDPMVFAGVTVLLVATGLLAAFVPARRASRIDPQTALRCE